MRTKLIVGLGRHAGTEAPGTGASPGTEFLFSSLEESLGRHFSLVRVPAYYYAMDARRALRMALDLMSKVDACILGLPPHPLDLDPFFVVRAHMGRRIPFVYMPLGEFPRGAWFYRHIYQRLRSQDLILFSSSADRAIYDALVASTPARVAVVPFGIRVAPFRASTSGRSVTRGYLGLEPDDIVFVYHGRVTAEKNVHAAIMMFRHVARECPRTRLWIIGHVDGDHAGGGGPRHISSLPPNPLTRAFRELLSGAGLEDRVTFWGGVSRGALPELLSAADIGVNLTLNGDENFGYSTIEAMAAGLPVIGSDWGGLKDTIENGVSGFLIPTVVTQRGVGIDHWRARQSALYLLENPDRRREMGNAAALRVARLFSLERFADSVAREVRAQVMEPDTGSHAEHVWSPLGQRFTKQYSTTLPRGPVRSFPIAVVASAALFIEHPLMRKVVLRYATGAQRVTPRFDAVLFLASDLFNVRGTSLRSIDPRLTAKVTLVEAVDRAVVRILKQRGFEDCASLTRKLADRFGRESIGASLRRLLRIGIILQSEGTPMAPAPRHGRPHADALVRRRRTGMDSR